MGVDVAACPIDVEVRQRRKAEARQTRAGVIHTALITTRQGAAKFKSIMLAAIGCGITHGTISGFTTIPSAFRWQLVVSWVTC
jgi:hypothetical protein